MNQQKIDMEFELGDIVRQCGHEDCLFVVTGVIHDDERLFVVDESGRYGDGDEFELTFAEVSDQYRRLETKK